MATLTTDPLLDLLAEIARRRRRSLSAARCREIDRAWVDLAQAASDEGSTARRDSIQPTASYREAQ